jgi:hypothetical protein
MFLPERSGGGVFPEITEEEVVEAVFALVAAKEAEAQKKVLDVFTMRARGVGGLAARAFREAVHDV